jgi:hypothetical protein
MAGLVPATHVFICLCVKDVDAWHKAGHDESEGYQISRPSTFSDKAFTCSGIFCMCGLTASALR